MRITTLILCLALLTGAIRANADSIQTVGPHSDTGTIVSNSAPADLFLGDILVAQCLPSAACNFATLPDPFTYTSTPAQTAALGAGAVDLAIVQTAQSVRLDETTLLQMATVPEPASFALLGTGLLACAAVIRRNRHR